VLGNRPSPTVGLGHIHGTPPRRKKTRISSPSSRELSEPDRRTRPCSWHTSSVKETGTSRQASGPDHRTRPCSWHTSFGQEHTDGSLGGGAAEELIEAARVGPRDVGLRGCRGVGRPPRAGSP